MSVYTRRAEHIFAPTDAAGRPRGPRISDVRTWGIEVEHGQIEFGTWTPALTFETPSGETITLSTATGLYIRTGDLWRVSFSCVTSTFTHASSGALKITGLPVTPVAAAYGVTTEFQGITKAGYTRIGVVAPAGADYLTLSGSGSGQNISPVSAADMPTGGSVTVRGLIAISAARG